MAERVESEGSQFNTPIKGRQLKYFSSPDGGGPDRVGGVEAAPEEKRRSCNCKNSKCLKLYCECFSSGNYCNPQSCNCMACGNNPVGVASVAPRAQENEKGRKSAIDATLERDPHAFRPKISSPLRGEGEKTYFRGCNCKKSVCLKKYCECFQSGFYCTSLCKCIECKNFEGSREMLTARELSSPLRSPTASQKRGRPSPIFFNTGYKPNVPYTIPNGAVVIPPPLCNRIKNATFESFCDDILLSLYNSLRCVVRKGDSGSVSEEHERIVYTALRDVLAAINADMQTDVFAIWSSFLAGHK